MEIDNEVRNILNCLYENGFKAYIIGGAIRNYLLGFPYNDYDICTDATPDDLTHIFYNYSFIDQDKKYGSFKLQQNNCNIEITTFRKEFKYIDSRHPSKVVFVHSLEHDIVRRDFTINSIAYSLNEGIIDILNGIEDINKKQIKCIGDSSQKFTEDPLRMLRAIRLSSEYCLSIEENTLKAIKNNISKLDHINPTKLFQELQKYISSKNFNKYLDKYKFLFISLFSFTDNIYEFNKEYINYDTDLYYKISMLLNGINDYLYKMIILFYYFENNNDYKATEFFLKRYGISNAILKKIVQSIENIKFILSLNKITDGIKLLFKNKEEAINLIKICINIAKLEKLNDKILNLTVLYESILKQNFNNKLDLDGKYLYEIFKEETSLVKQNIYNKVIKGELYNDNENILRYIDDIKKSYI